MKKKIGKKLLPQVTQITEMVASPHSDAVLLLLQDALEACGGQGNWGEDVQYTLKDNPDLLNLIHALQPRDMAEMMLICQFVVLHSKGMHNMYKNCPVSAMDYIKLSHETFSLICRYRGKTAQNINVTYNVISDKAQINAQICPGVPEKINDPHGKR